MQRIVGQGSAGGTHRLRKRRNTKKGEERMVDNGGEGDKDGEDPWDEVA